MNTLKSIKHLLALVALMVSFTTIQAEQFTLLSPDKQLSIQVKADDNLTYSVSHQGEMLIAPSSLFLESSISEATTFSQVLRIDKGQQTDDFDLVWGTTSHVSEAYDFLSLWFTPEIGVEFRAYNSGLAWRYITNVSDDIVVTNEKAEFNFVEESAIYFPHVDGFSNPFEPEYLPQNGGAISEGSLGLTPLMNETQSGKVVIVTDVNLFSYPGMFVQKSDKGYEAIFPAYPAKEREQILGRLRLINVPQLSKKMVVADEAFIAKKDASTVFPWRTILVASHAEELLTNDLVSALAVQPTDDFSWVKPGKVAWDWYHKWDFEGVDFKAGINTATYKYMIDFAAEHHIEYVNIDDGWCTLHNFERINRHLDLEEVLAYAKEKEVGIFLWATWQTLELDLEANLDRFEAMGIAGLKVDFFDRCDQKVVDFINTLAEESADRHLLLNLHGMYKPTGIQVTYPNVLNLEGVMGLEYNKFTSKCTPQHNTTIPFARNVVGPMDYTPGGMYYMDSVDFKKSWANPHVMTNKAQQMAMYVVYHGGLQMLADSPTKYLGDKVALSFLEQVPVTWDETVALQGEIGEVVAVARRSGEVWYIGAINNVAMAKLSIDLSFLNKQKYTATVWENGESLDELLQRSATVTSESKLNFELGKADGVVIRLEVAK